MDRFLEFTSEHTFLVVALTVSFFVLIFSELKRKASGLLNLDTSDAISLINADAAVIDLRNAEAFGRGHIVNARNIPLDEFDAEAKRVSQLKDKPVIAVCDSGTSSSKIVATLRAAGFEKAYGLKGGMTAWSQAGLPVVTGKKTRSKNKT